MKTINLKGKDYAPVSARLEEIHKEIANADDKNLSITTEVTFQEGYAYFKATIQCYRGTFTGHSFGQLKQEKALEKLETVAVGRALAFAGYLAGGEVASYDEIEKFNDGQVDF